MKKFITFILILLSIASGFFYLGYKPSLDDIDVTGSLFGFNVQMSQYTLYGILIVIFMVVLSILKFFVGIKNIYNGIIHFFTGRSKEKAIDNLLNAYAHLVGNKPKTAKNFLRKAEKYYKDSEHLALIRLMIEHSQASERPSSDALAKLENHKLLKPIGSYVESLFPVSQKDDMRVIALLKEAGNYTESLDVFYDYLTILIRNQDYTEAEIALKNARSIVPEEAYKFHSATILLLKSYHAYDTKNPDQMLALGLESLKSMKNPIAIHLVMQAYKTLQRDNKAIRMLQDYFMDMPTMNHIRLFLDFKTNETPEETGKRIASLPRNHDNAESFLALQAYHFALTKDFISLNTVLNNAHDYSESLWVKVSQLCLAVEKDTFLLNETVKLFKDAFDAECRQEILDMYHVRNHGNIYQNTVMYQKFIPEITKAEVIAKISLFKNMLKSIPIIQKKNVLRTGEPIESPNLYQLEANIHKNLNI